jgi:LysR family hydrogen peroxide-inducible transcriptional activator
MELHQLRYFVAVAQTESFSRAAELCHVSQPSLSQQIAKLEKQLGRKLFDRLSRGVALTDAGHTLLESATVILNQLEDTEKRLRDTNDLQDARLSIGAIPTIAPYLLPQHLQKYHKAYPEVELTVQEDVTQNLINAMVSGEVDIALMALPLGDDRIAHKELFSEPLLVALPPDHNLVNRRTIKTDQLQNERFIVLGDMHCLGEQVLSFCRVNNYSSRIGCRSAQIATIQELILSGQGISLLPQMAIPESPAEDGTLPVYRPLSGQQPVRTIVAAWHRHRYLSLAAKRFLEVLQDVSKSE